MKELMSRPVSSSCVINAFDAASYARDASIIRDISETTSTFDCSSVRETSDGISTGTGFPDCSFAASSEPPICFSQVGVSNVTT